MTSKKLNQQEMYELRCLAAKQVAYLMQSNDLLAAQEVIQLVACATNAYSAITYLETTREFLEHASDDLWQETQDMLNIYHELRTAELRRNKHNA